MFTNESSKENSHYKQIQNTCLQLGGHTFCVINVGFKWNARYVFALNRSWLSSFFFCYVFLFKAFCDQLVFGCFAFYFLRLIFLAGQQLESLTGWTPTLLIWFLSGSSKEVRSEGLKTLWDLWFLWTFFLFSCFNHLSFFSTHMLDLVLYHCPGGLWKQT